MLNSKSHFWLALSVVASLSAFGCGQKRVDSTQMPNGGEAGLKAAQTASGHYFVERHDCLWTIAAQPRIYGDAFQWPELFKANRDEIKDPDLIYPRQDLKVEKGLTRGEMDLDRKLAMSTPKYVPHSKPRTTLPVDYF